MKYLLLSLLFVFFVSCNLKLRDSNAHLPGIYVYELGSGLYHTLEIYDDFTFQQCIYSEKDGELLHENKGEMYVEKTDIKFENWLECYYEEQPRNYYSGKPYVTNLIGSYWLKYTDSEEIQIVIFDVTNYIFKKEI
ncbi:hypothetical protein [Flavobacterium sp. I3-2]|uniref:hypothetical protein n=1 Tax=Flavobacterium sp. I3-2 TaxID=2748319 RepID=UPI0015B37B77|nr:hypothetical protein [Flavobacterium sp. I3-2]